MTGLFSKTRQSKNRFYELDYQVMKHAFEIHNRLGRFHDEQVYQNELLYLLRCDGLAVESEVPLHIRFSSFEKTYYLDLVIEGNHICELKALSDLTNQCRSQTINYLCISDDTYAKLINFGSGALLSLSRSLFNEWGSRLDPALYTEALMALTPSSKEDRIQIISDDRTIGTKLVNLIAPRTAFKITTSKNPSPLKNQFQKFINHADLNRFIWINLNGNHVSYTTLKKNHPVI